MSREQIVKTQIRNIPEIVDRFLEVRRQVALHEGDLMEVDVENGGGVRAVFTGLLVSVARMPLSGSTDAVLVVRQSNGEGDRAFSLATVREIRKAPA